MKTNDIKQRKISGMTNDQIYESEVSLLGLFGIAFFGHKATKQQRRKLTNIWKQILNN